MRWHMAIFGVVVLGVGLAVAAHPMRAIGPDEVGALGPRARHMDRSGDVGPLHSEIQALRDAAHDQIRALLTPEQQTQFDTLRPADRPGRMAGLRPCGRTGSGERGGRGGPRMGRGHLGGPAGPGDEMFLERMTARLSLTEEQRTAVGAILDSAKTAREAKITQAKADFRALLTPEQVTKLDDLEAAGPGPRPGFGRFGGRGHGTGPGAGGALQLTAEQRTQADGIFSKLHSDLRQMHADTRQQIEAQLTDSQKALLPPVRAGGGPGRGGRGPAGGRSGMPDTGMMLQHLTRALNLTEEQQASVKTILDNTHTAIQEKIKAARDAKEPGTATNPANKTNATKTSQGTDE